MQLHAGAAAAATAEAGVPLSHATYTRSSHPTSESSSSINSTSLTPVNSSSLENTLNMRTGQFSGRLVTDSGAALQAVDNVRHKDYPEEQLLPRGLPGRYQDTNNTNRKDLSRTTLNNTNDLETDGDGPVRPTGARAGMLPGVSRVLFDNAVKENAKLKKMLHEVLQKDGSSMKVFLVS